MKIIKENFYDIKIEEETCIALGTFDGVHTGHRRIIDGVVKSAKEKGMKSAVLTFDKHPLTILRPKEEVKLIIDNSVKAEIISRLGVDYLIFINFDEEFAKVEARAFIDALITNFNAKVLACGYNYNFGFKGMGNVELLRELEKKLFYKLSVMERVTYHNHIVSSSDIRNKIQAGKIPDANTLLGYKLFYKGIVETGNKLGRHLGFPTANIEIIQNSCLKNGVYITNTYIEGNSYQSVSNVGFKPTIGEHKRNIETYILDFEDNLYGKEIKVEFLEFIRDEKKFDSIEELKKRVHRDISTATEYFSNVCLQETANLL